MYNNNRWRCILEIREDKIRPHRIAKLDKIFHENDFVTAKKIMTTFEVCKRTVQRDIEFLRDRYDAPIGYKKNKGYYYTDKTFALKNLSLREGELFVITSILPLMEQYKNTPLEKSFKKIAERISESFSDEIIINSGFINEGIRFISDPLPNIEGEIFNSVLDAIIKKITIEMEYISLKRNYFERRMIDCYKIICQKGNWYVLGLEKDSKKIKTFSLSRMKNVLMTEKHFTIPSNFNVENYIDPHFGVWNNKNEPTEYEFIFAKEIGLYISERTWWPGQVIKQNDDGTVYLKFKTNQEQEIRNWVRSWGNLVRVLSPKKLQKELIENATQVLSMYKKK